MEDISTLTIIGIVISVLLPTGLLILGKTLSKDKDDPGIQKVGRMLMNLGKFMLFLIMLSGIYRLIWYFLKL